LGKDPAQKILLFILRNWIEYRAAPISVLSCMDLFLFSNPG